MRKRKYLPKQDQIPPYKEERTIYDVSNWTIIRKNFIAGIGRSAGIWFFNIAILALLAKILIPILGPKVTGFFDEVPTMLNETFSKMETDFSNVVLPKHN